MHTYRGYTSRSWLKHSLCYKPEGRGSDSRCHWIFQLTQPSSRITDLASTQPLTEMSTNNLPGDKGREVREKGWQPHRYLWADCLRQCGRFDDPKGLHSVYGDSFPFDFYLPRKSDEVIKLLTSIRPGQRPSWLGVLLVFLSTLIVIPGLS
jgi:hypothetical protein